MKRTPLYERYSTYPGVKLIDFGGWELPVQFASGILSEHEAVRTKAGLFDVSHMGECMVSGESADAYLDYLCTNSISDMAVGQCRYTLMCYPNGTVVDDRALAGACDIFRQRDPPEVGCGGSSSRSCGGYGCAVRACAPVDDLGLVEGEAVIVGGVQAGHLAHSAVDVDEPLTGAADEVVVVVPDAALVAGGGAGGLDAPDDPLVDEDTERVVHGLPGDGAEFAANGLGHTVGGDVRGVADGTEDREPLCGDLQAAAAQHAPEVLTHDVTLTRDVDIVQNWT